MLFHCQSTTRSRLERGFLFALLLPARNQMPKIDTGKSLDTPRFVVFIIHHSLWAVKCFDHILWYYFFMKTLSEKLKELRLEKNLTQKQVAQLLGLTQNAIGNYEAGIREPSLSTLKQICDLFDVPADYLIGRIDSY